MKKIFSLLVILVTILLFNIKAYAVTAPELRITTNSYTSGSKMTKIEVTSVEEGKTLQLYAIIGYGNDMYDPYNPDSIGWYVQEANLKGVTWTSSNSNIARVDATGKVTGVKEGKVTITARYNGQSDNYVVDVHPQSDTGYTGIGFLRATGSQTLKVNENFEFILYLFDIPETEKANIKFTINNKSIAKINNIDLCNWSDGSGKDIVIANTAFLAPGEATITAKVSYNGKTYADSYTFNVIGNGNSNLSISTGEKNNNSSKLEVGDNLQLSPKLDKDNKQNDLSSKDVKWSSSDENVAIINNHGVVTATGKGNATITAEYEVGDEKVKATYDLKIMGSRRLNPQESTTLPIVENVVILLVGAFIGTCATILIYKRKSL